MGYTYHEIKDMTVVKLREIAVGIEHEAVKGYSQMNKEHLLAALCKALNIDMHEHHKIVGIDKTPLKAQIKQWKKKRDEALSTRKRKEFKTALCMIHRLKRRLHKAAV